MYIYDDIFVSISITCDLSPIISIQLTVNRLQQVRYNVYIFLQLEADK